MKIIILLISILSYSTTYSNEFELSWSSYLGGNNDDEIKNIESDKNGDIYVVGYTKSIDYPTTNDAFQKSHGGDIDIFITKYDKNMSVVWSTFLGGNNRDIVHKIGITEDALWIVGETLSNNYPTTSNAISKNYLGGSGDIILSKFSLNGQMLYSTYYGGEGYDPAAGMAIDSDDNLWVTGRTNSNNFRTTPNAMKSNLDGNYDSYILKVSKNGELLYCSLIGGENSDYGFSVSFSETDNQVAISGFTESKNYPIKGTTLQPSKYGGQNQFDIFISIFNIDGSLNWSSLFGGSGQDYPVTIKYDSQGNLITHIYTTSNDLVTNKNSYYQYNFGKIDNYLMKIDRDKNISWSSYFGGAGVDGEDNIFHKFGDMVIDKYDNIYLSAFTRSTDLPVSSNSKFNKLNGTLDCYFAKWSYEGELLFSSYLGGSNFDEGRSVCVLSDKVIIAGWTLSSDFPTTNDAQFPNAPGGRDGFISVFGISDFCKEEFNSDYGFSKLKLHTNKPIFEEDAFRLTSLYEFDLGYMFYDEKVNLAGGFQSEFSFLFSGGTEDAIKRSIIPTGILADSSLPGADGVAFIISGSLPTEFRGDGGGIGYNGISNAIAIEIDLWGNDEYSDPNGNHLAVQIPDRKGVLKTKHTDETTVYMNKDIVTILSDSTQSYTCRIEYQNHNLKIYLNESDKPSTLIVELTDFPLEEYITLDKGSNGYVGLTSSTGIAAEYHDILHWDLCALRDPQVVNTVLSEKSNDITVYPNPMDDILSIDLPAITTEELTIVVTDYLGRKVYGRNTNALSNKLELNLSSLLSGVYNISIIEGTNNIYTTKIVKR